MKYGNKKQTIDGITFDSRKEARRYAELKMLEKAGVISGLELQKEFELIPAQYDNLSRSEYIKHNGKKTRGKLLERAVKYKADFCYFDKEKKQLIVEDTKGFKTKDYIIKRKLMLWVYGIKIVEI